MKRTLALLLAVLVLVSCIPAGAITLETVESSEETATVVAEKAEKATDEEAELAAVTYTAKPGLNAVNNTAEIETFDDETDFSALNITFVGVGENGDTPAYEIAQDPLNTADETDKALIFYGKVPASDSDHTVYSNFYITMGVDLNRKYYTTVSVYEPEKTGNFLWIMRTDGSIWGDSGTAYKNAVAAGNYYTYPKVLTANLNMTKIEYRVKAVGKTGEDGTTYVDTYVPFYVDNLAVVPYYKIIYHGVTEVQTLFENEDKPSMDTIRKTYTVSSSYKPYETTKVSETTGAVMEFAGWSTKKDGTVEDIVTEITLANEDIYLYPVWVEPGLVTGAPYMNAKSGTTNTLTATEASVWEFVDGGNTDVTAEDVVFSEDGLTCTITAKGYTGEVTVKATAVADETKTATVKVRLRGAGDDFKPGLNQLTGTEEGYDFEATAAERNLTYSIPNSNVTKLVDIPRYTPGVNTSYKAISMVHSGSGTGQTFPQISYKLPTNVFARPIHYELVYTGVAGHMWFMNGSAVDLDVSGMINISKSEWTKSSKKWTPIGTSAFIQTAINYSQASNIFYMDKVKLIPYYAMTYVGLDGTTEVAIKYELLTAGGNIMKEYTPDNSVVEGATGYALEAGGKRVPVVNLNNKDLTFFAIDTDEASFIAYDNTYANVALEEGATEYTFVTPAELGLETEKYFMYWTDGTNKYYPGDTITAEEFIGKNFEAYEFEYPLFDEKYGELIAYYDFNENLKATYINSDYDTNGVNSTVTFGASNPSEGDGGKLAIVERADGRKVAHFYTTKNNASYRFVQLNIKSSIPAKYTPIAGIMLPEGFPRLYYSSAAPWLRVYGKKTDGSDTYSDKFYGIGSTSNSNVTADKVNSDNLTYGRSTVLTLASLSYVGLNWNASRYHKNGYHFDNYGVYAFPQYAVFFKDSADSDNYTKQTLDTSAGNPTTYTFPEAEDVIALGAGFEKSHFVAWTIDGNTFYKPGETVALSVVQYKVIYPYLQDPSVPAMGYAYEGATSVPVAKTNNYYESIKDDGRDVLHAVQWGTTYEKSTTYVKDENGKNTSEVDYITYKYVTDPRFQLAGAKYAFDASEYYHVQYMAKIAHASSVLKNTFKDTTPGDYTAEEREAAGFYTPAEIKAKKNWVESAKTSFRIYYWTSTASNGYYNNGEHLVGNNGHEMDVDDNYHLLEVDMSVASNGNSKAPWLGGTDGKIYGFCIDPSKLTWGADMYIDYIRVYRGGISTVNYDTNAPEGVSEEDIITNVEADTNRGVGTGYLLKGERPEITGYKFMGWSKTPDSKYIAENIVTEIDLTGAEATVYAVWEKDTGAIDASDEVAMRLDEGKTNGIRFKATVTNDQRENVDEYGFIVARKSHLDTYDAELTHNFKNRAKSQNLFVEGQAYGYSEEYGKDIDIIFNAVEATGEVTYAIVCTGMKIDATGVNEVMVARPYYRYTINGKDIYVYGEAAESSLGAVAAEIDKNGTDYEKNKDYIDEILSCVTPAE